MSIPNWLRLVHLADSALPIGGTAHSYGLETLVDAGLLAPAQLYEFLDSYLVEAGQLEAVCCWRGHALGEELREGVTATLVDEWVALNQECSAVKLARESRQASLSLGGRLLHLLCALEANASLSGLLERTEAVGGGVHHSCVFGLAGGWLGGEPAVVAAVCLRQLVAGLVAACQKLAPLGQVQAAAIQWQLYPRIEEIALAAKGMPAMFVPLVEVASMRHPALPVRLFIS